MEKSIEDILQITEFGAAETVPGSKFVLKVGKKNCLVDVGKSYNSKEDDADLPFDSRSIDCLLFTHGHADHMGEMLKLVKSGFKGNVFATYETAAITKLQLNQEVASVFIHNKTVKGKRYTYGPNKGKWVPFKKVLYSNQDVKDAMALFQSSDEKKLGFPYEKTISISDDVRLAFYEAGHIPGSAQILFDIKRDNKNAKILFSYDLGRTDYKVLSHGVADIPIVKFPYTNFPKDIDYVIVESTYGDKVHNNLEDSIKILEEAAKDAAKNNGKLIIPAFSIMRTHMLWNFLFRLNQEGRLPKDMMFCSSSPLANQVSKIILSNMENMDKKAMKEFASMNYNPFQFDKLVHHKSLAETKELLKSNSPLGFIASSGMCEGGRVVSILESTISDPKNIVLLTGYASPGTRSAMLINKEKYIPFYKGLIELKADVRKMGGLSGHADGEEIVAHLRNIRDPAKGEQFKGVFIKHGEKDACYKLKDKIIKAGYDANTVHVMKKNQPYVL